MQVETRLTVRGIVFSALFAALVVALNFVNIPLPFSPVPITLGNFAVMLAGAILGAWYGFFSVFLVVFLTALGLPLIGGAGGLGLILGPNGGFVWFWPLCAFAVGWFSQRIRGNSGLAFVKLVIVIEVFGSLFNYVGGVPQLAAVAHLPFHKALVEGFFPFLPGDFAKAVVAALVTLPVRRIYPVSRLLGGNRNAVVNLSNDDSATDM
ncbi:biotin transporter BioY [Alicyclobacillus sp. SO9]|uniref:biotin transporter BioY n=1 Tax=Alicyclobacillus sp. SO9 TaxID=2665646 RepID=UPI0018E78003|nr:biotin transporter BioY [Alicyclobacillus sp. SO9]QQE78139.1 biotin transporter BioY [Alicyclobacillus sp. SO9]